MTPGEYRVPVIITDADIEAGVCVESTAASAHAGLLLRCARYDTGEITGYYLAIHPNRDRLEFLRLGPSPVVLGAHSMAVEPGARYDLRVKLRGSTVTVALAPGPEPVIACSNLNATVDGAVGFSSCDGPAWFSHLYVTPIVANQAENWRDYPLLGTSIQTLTPLAWRGDGQPYSDHDYWFAWWYRASSQKPRRP